MNEIVTDFEHKALSATESDSLSSCKAAYQGVGSQLFSVIKRGKVLYRTIRNPYHTGLIGISVIALLGYIFACRRNGRFI